MSKDIIQTCSPDGTIFSLTNVGYNQITAYLADLEDIQNARIAEGDFVRNTRLPSVEEVFDDAVLQTYEISHGRHPDWVYGPFVGRDWNVTDNYTPGYPIHLTSNDIRIYQKNKEYER